MSIFSLLRNSGKGLAIIAGAFISTTTLGAALITGTTGAVTEIAPPASVAPGALESDAQIIIFSEASLTLLAAEAVDHAGAGAVSSPGGLAPGVISSGANVTSFLLSMDKVGSSATLINLLGSVTFDMDILGLEVFTASLNGSDATYGNPGTTYPTSARGLELFSQDTFEISNDLRTLNVDLQTSDAVDQVRIYVDNSTSAIPEPTTWLMMGTGLIGLSALRRRRK